MKPVSAQSQRGEALSRIIVRISRKEFLTQEQKCQQIIQLCEEKYANLDGISLSTAFNRLSHHLKTEDYFIYADSIRSLLQRVVQIQQTLDPFAISNILNALSKWVRDITQSELYTEVVETLVRQAIQEAEHFTPVEIANVLNALSKWPISLNEGPYNEAVLVLMKQLVTKAQLIEEARYITLSLQATANLGYKLPNTLSEPLFWRLGELSDTLDIRAAYQLKQYISKGYTLPEGIQRQIASVLQELEPPVVPTQALLRPVQPEEQTLTETIELVTQPVVRSEVSRRLRIRPVKMETLKRDWSDFLRKQGISTERLTHLWRYVETSIKRIPKKLYLSHKEMIKKRLLQAITRFEPGWLGSWLWSPTISLDIERAAMAFADEKVQSVPVSLIQHDWSPYFLQQGIHLGEQEALWASLRQAEQRLVSLEQYQQIKKPMIDMLIETKRVAQCLGFCQTEVKKLNREQAKQLFIQPTLSPQPAIQASSH